MQYVTTIAYYMLTQCDSYLDTFIHIHTHMRVCTHTYIYTDIKIDILLFTFTILVTRTLKLGTQLTFVAYATFCWIVLLKK